MARVLAGETALFEIVMRRYNERAHRTARARLRETLLERTGAATGEVFHFHASRCDRVVAHVLGRITGPPAAS